MSTVLYHTLEDKFREVAEADVLKVVGNLVYYRHHNMVRKCPHLLDPCDTDLKEDLVVESARAEVSEYVWWGCVKAG